MLTKTTVTPPPPSCRRHQRAAAVFACDDDNDDGRVAAVGADGRDGYNTAKMSSSGWSS